jgi:hypothetical protein
MDEKVKFIGIKTKNGIYISDNVTGKSEYSFNSKVNDIKFDGKLATSSYLKDWVLTEKIPETMEIKIPEKRINIRRELKDGFPESDKTPKVIPLSYLDEDGPYAGVSSLYELKFDIEPEQYLPIEFEVNIIDSLDDFKPVVTQYKIENSLLDTMMFHPVLLSTKPCKLSVDQTYKIIREYVKTHIDSEWAKVTSDYDFCFTVKKIINLDEPESYSVDVANINNWNRRKRKSKYETRYRKFREIEIFQMAPKPYQRYTVIEPFVGKDYDDLVNNINSYLSALIEKINEPAEDCPNCHGLGVIINQ